MLDPYKGSVPLFTFFALSESSSWNVPNWKANNVKEATQNTWRDLPFQTQPENDPPSFAKRHHFEGIRPTPHWPVQVSGSHVADFAIKSSPCLFLCFVKWIWIYTYLINSAEICGSSRSRSPKLDAKKRHRNWLSPTAIKSASMIRETPGRLGEFP